MNKKKLISILTTVGSLVLALVLVLVSHHNIKTAENNNTVLAESFTEMGKLLTGIIEAGGSPQMLEYVRVNKPRAVKVVNDLRGVCDYFEKVTVPGSLKAELAEVRAGIPEMRNFLDKFESMFGDVMLESEFKANVGAAADAVSGFSDNDSFIMAEQRFMKKLERLRSRKGGLMWL